MTMPFYPDPNPGFTYKTTTDYGQLILEILERGIDIIPGPNGVQYGFTIRLAKDPGLQETDEME